MSDKYDNYEKIGQPRTGRDNFGSPAHAIQGVYCDVTTKGRRASVSRRAFLKGGPPPRRVSASLIRLSGEAQLPEATDAARGGDSRSGVGVRYRQQVPNRTTLLEFLREDLKLTGTKMGCDRAQCGACTVILNDRNVYSCTTLAVEASGGEVLTIEGLAANDALHPIQQAFVEHSGFQCGFCTSGQLMTTKVLPTDADPTRTGAARVERQPVPVSAIRSRS